MTDKNISEILSKFNLEIDDYGDIGSTNDTEIVDITLVEGFGELNDGEKYTLLTTKQQNQETFFHQVFKKGDARKIENLVNALTNEKLIEALKLQNASGLTAVDQLDKSELQAVLTLLCHI